MAGIYTRDQEKAIFAKNRRDIANIQEKQRMGLLQNQMRANEGSVPKHEETYKGRVFQNIKRITGQRDAIIEAQKQQREAENEARKKFAAEQEIKIKQQMQLRRDLLDKKISLDEFNEKMSKINPGMIRVQKGALPKPEQEVKIDKPTFQSEKAKQVKPEKIETPSADENIGEQLFQRLANA